MNKKDYEIKVIGKTHHIPSDRYFWVDEKGINVVQSSEIFKTLKELSEHNLNNNPNFTPTNPSLLSIWGVQVKYTGALKKKESSRILFEFTINGITSDKHLEEEYGLLEEDQLKVKQTNLNRVRRLMIERSSGWQDVLSQLEFCFKLPYDQKKIFKELDVYWGPDEEDEIEEYRTEFGINMDGFQ